MDKWVELTDEVFLGEHSTDSEPIIPEARNGREGMSSRKLSCEAQILGFRPFAIFFERRDVSRRENPLKVFFSELSDLLFPPSFLSYDWKGYRKGRFLVILWNIDCGND